MHTYDETSLKKNISGIYDLLNPSPLVGATVNIVIKLI